MDRDRLQTLLDAYVDERIVNVEADTVGVSNATYFVRCASGERFVVRLIRVQTRESVRAEALIQRRLREVGVGSPLYLAQADGDIVASIDGVDCTVARHVAGSHPAAISSHLITDFGRTLAIMHHALAQDEIAITYNSGQWLDLRNARHDAQASPTDVRPALLHSLEVSSALFEHQLPMSVIHGEFASNNVFAVDNRVSVVFDWETVQYAPRILDLAFTWLSVAYDDVRKATELREALLAGYALAAQSRLSADELAALPLAVSFVAAAAASWCYKRGYSDYGERFLAAGAAFESSVREIEEPRRLPSA